MSANAAYDPDAIDDAHRARWAGRRCSKCGETGHRADDIRHGGNPSRAIVRAQGAHPWGLSAKTPASRSKRDPGRCSLCGSLEHDRRGHGTEATTAPAPSAKAAKAPKVAVARDGFRPRAKTIPIRGRLKEVRSQALTVADDAELDAARPRTREDCKGGFRPCPFVSCSHHLAVDINPQTGALKVNFPHLDVWEMAETCSLDVADRGGITLEEVGSILNLTRERIRQVEAKGMVRLRRGLPPAESNVADPQTFNPFFAEAT